MITLLSIFTILYVYSIYDIRKESGSWSEFDPSNTKYGLIWIFVSGSTVILIIIAYLIIKYLP